MRASAFNFVPAGRPGGTGWRWTRQTPWRIRARAKGEDRGGGFTDVGGFGSNTCIFIDCFFNRVFTSLSVDNHCIPQRAPLTYQLSKLTLKFAKQDFERSCVERRVESFVACALNVKVLKFKDSLASKIAE